MRDIRSRLFPGAAGTLTWTWAGGGTATVGYTVSVTHDGPTITFQYRLRGTEDLRVSVRLQPTPTRFGGRRWWFTCPPAVNGRACGRRAGKLHLPPGGRYFGCRKCHDLTDRSCQEAHQAERRFGRFGFGPEAARLWSARRGSRG